MKENNFDPFLNLLLEKHHPLDYLFSPKSIAVIGATDREGSVGKTVLLNLMRGSFEGKIYPVNPKKNKVLECKAYTNISKINDSIDLAVIVTPSKTVPGIIDECIKKKVPTVIIISAGFKELGESGKNLENEIKEKIKNKNIRIIGPNCLGVMNPVSGLNATFASDMALKGNIAFISQSGALCTAVLDWSLKENIGFSSFVSIGSMMDIDWGDLIHYFGKDKNTKSILIYMESIGNPRSFLSAAKKVALSKPIIVIKAGITQESAKAAASHTGALTGSDEVFNAALKRIGVLRVDNIYMLFNIAEILSKQPLPKGPNLAIVTNAGGPGVISTDALIQSGGKLAKLKEKTINELNKILPAAWSHNNPIDILGDATPDLYYSAVEVIAKDENVDGILVILTPQYMTDPTETANKIKMLASKIKKPLLTSWMGAKTVEKGGEILSNSNIPMFNFPDTACIAFSYMYKYSENLKALYETPSLEEVTSNIENIAKRKEKISSILNVLRKEKRLLLDEIESKEVLKAYDIPVTEMYVAKNKEEAVLHAEKIGYPVVLKIFSHTITHKSDIGGVKLNLKNKKSVEEAFDNIYKSVKEKASAKDILGVTVQPMIKDLEGYELILGSSTDPEFGPVILFGTGGQLVEIFKDRELGLPPLTSTLARTIMKKTKIYNALKGVRGRKQVDIEGLEKILVRFSTLISEYPEIEECDINPLLINEKQIIALDARIVLHKKDAKPPQIAIRPYPTKYVSSWQLKDKKKVIIRPIRPEDVPLVKEFYKDLADTKKYQKRYSNKMQHLPLHAEFFNTKNKESFSSESNIIRACFEDYAQQLTLVVEKDNKEILAMIKLVRIENNPSLAQFIVVVKDKWQGQGIGSKLMDLMIEIAKSENIKKIYANMLKDNKLIQKMCTKAGFKINEGKEENVVTAEIEL